MAVMKEKGLGSTTVLTKTHKALGGSLQGRAA